MREIAAACKGSPPCLLGAATSNRQMGAAYFPSLQIASMLPSVQCLQFAQTQFLPLACASQYCQPPNQAEHRSAKINSVFKSIFQMSSRARRWQTQVDLVRVLCSRTKSRPRRLPSRKSITELLAFGCLQLHFIRHYFRFLGFLSQLNRRLPTPQRTFPPISPFLDLTDLVVVVVLIYIFVSKPMFFVCEDHLPWLNKETKADQIKQPSFCDNSF